MVEFHLDGSAAIALSVAIDLAIIATITAQVTAALAGAPSATVVLMCDVTLIDSTELGALVAARKACIAQGIPFAIGDPSPRARRVLQLTDLDLVMDVRLGAAGAPRRLAAATWAQHAA